MLEDDEFQAMFQLGHFFSEMDRHSLLPSGGRSWCFNWATSSQKWIDDGCLVGITVIDRRFNWATSFQKWIGGKDRTGLMASR